MADFAEFARTFRVTNTSIGCNYPLSVSVYEGEVAFLSETGPHILSAGAVEPVYIGDKISEIFLSRTYTLTNRSKRNNWHGALTRHHYIITYSEPAGEDAIVEPGTAVTDTLGNSVVDTPGLTLCFDRRLGTWMLLANGMSNGKWRPTFSCWAHSDSAKFHSGDL